MSKQTDGWVSQECSSLSDSDKLILQTPTTYADNIPVMLKFKMHHTCVNSFKLTEYVIRCPKIKCESNSAYAEEMNVQPTRDAQSDRGQRVTCAPLYACRPMCVFVRLCVRVDECARNVIVGDYVRVHVHEC